MWRCDLITATLFVRLLQFVSKRRGRLICMWADDLKMAPVIKLRRDAALPFFFSVGLDIFSNLMNEEKPPLFTALERWRGHGSSGALFNETLDICAL